MSEVKDPAIKLFGRTIPLPLIIPANDSSSPSSSPPESTSAIQHETEVRAMNVSYDWVSVVKPKIEKNVLFCKSNSNPFFLKHLIVNGFVQIFVFDFNWIEELLQFSMATLSFFFFFYFFLLLLKCLNLLLSCGSNSLCGSHQWNWIESILEYKFEHIIFNIFCGLPCFALVFSIINFLI